MELLKDKLANERILSAVVQDLKSVYPELKHKAFLEELLLNLTQKALKERVRHLAALCQKYLPQPYKDALLILYRFTESKENHFIYLFLPTFVMLFGRKEHGLSMKALRDFTQYSSSEEGVRPFLEDDLGNTLSHMMRWTRSKNQHIRRLASEGCRPRLPWASKIDALIQNPQHTYPILEALRLDASKYVQKSVANHINDISKDHPDWIVEKIASWDLTHPSTAWIVKHGLRTLIKNGHKPALRIMKSDQKPAIVLKEVQCEKQVRFGNKWEFSFLICSTKSTSQQLTIDYKIHFLKQNGKLNAKTFKLKTLNLKSGSEFKLKKHYHFKNYSTRKHHIGQHRWELIINGESQFIKTVTLLK